MKTPAEKAGFVVGQQYRTKDDSWVGGGHVVEFIRDDGTECPWFKGPTAYKGNQFAEVPHKLERVSPEPVESLSYTIESNKDSTTVFVRKQLSLDQIKRIMDILGE